MTRIGGGAFKGCNSLTSITVSKNNSEYKSENNCILTKDGKTLLLCRKHCIPSSVTTIGAEAFSGDTILKSMVVPNGVTMIGEHAFSYSGLQSIVIPNSMAEIGDNAFFSCIRLQSIVIPDSVTTIGESAFQDCISLQSITIATQEKEPDLSLERIEYLLQALSEYSEGISLRVPIGCGYAYKHYPAFEGKFKKVIANIDV